MAQIVWTDLMNTLGSTRLPEEELKEQLRIKDKVATGKTIRSIKTSVNGLTHEVSAIENLFQIDEGLPPNSNPNVNDIEAWMKAKGISGDPNLAQKITDIINRRGVPATPLIDEATAKWVDKLLILLCDAGFEDVCRVTFFRQNS